MFKIYKHERNMNKSKEKQEINIHELNEEIAK